jgi:hypothetical protein
MGRRSVGVVATSHTRGTDLRAVWLSQDIAGSARAATLRHTVQSISTTLHVARCRPSKQEKSRWLSTKGTDCSQHRGWEMNLD